MSGSSGCSSWCRRTHSGHSGRRPAGGQRRMGCKRQIERGIPLSPLVCVRPRQRCSEARHVCFRGRWHAEGQGWEHCNAACAAGCEGRCEGARIGLIVIIIILVVLIVFVVVAGGGAAELDRR